MEKRSVNKPIHSQRNKGLADVHTLSSPLFLNLETEERNLLFEKYVEVFQCEKRSYVFHQGDKPEYIYVLIDGTVQIEKIDGNGKRSILNSFRKPGTVFAEVYLYLGASELDYDCRCTQKAQILRIPKVVFEQNNHADGIPQTIKQKLADNLLVILSQKAFALNQKLIILSSYSLRQKIATYLLLNFDRTEMEGKKTLILPFTRQELAEYLGATRPALSRELNQMQQDGLLQFDKNQIQVIDRDKLQGLL